MHTGTWYCSTQMTEGWSSLLLLSACWKIPPLLLHYYYNERCLVLEFCADVAQILELPPMLLQLRAIAACRYRYVVVPGCDRQLGERTAGCCCRCICCVYCCYSYCYSLDNIAVLTTSASYTVPTYLVHYGHMRSLRGAEYLVPCTKCILIY